MADKFPPMPGHLPSSFDSDEYVFTTIAVRKTLLNAN